MKSKAVLILVAAFGVCASYFTLRAEAPAGTNTPPATDLAYPYRAECIITLDPQASRLPSTSTQAEPSGFQGDGTLRGQLIYLSHEWCVLKDGSSENWIPRAKVLLIRASK